MSMTVLLQELPEEAQDLLRAAWEERESVVLERNGEALAAVVPMDQYRRLSHPTEAASGATAAAWDALAYELPPGLLERYQQLVARKLVAGLTTDEERELEAAGTALDEADAALPLEQAADARARREHERRMALMDEVIARLRQLTSSQGARESSHTTPSG